MKYFRINIYLSVKNFFLSLLDYKSANKYDYEISKLLLKNSKKKTSIIN